MACCDPLFTGTNVTETEQLAPLAIVPEQVFVCEYSLPPVRLTVAVLPAVLVFVNVTVCGVTGLPTTWSPKLTLVGLAANDGPVPVPVRGRDCGLVGASSTTVTAPVCEPGVVGANVT